MVDDTGDAERRTRKRVRSLQRWLINPPLLLGVRLGLYPGHVLLETTGRRTGKTRRTIVGARRNGSSLWIVAEQGLHAGYVANLRARPDIRVFLDRRWRAATARLVADVDAEEVLDSLVGPSHARALRRFGTELRAIRVALLARIFRDLVLGDRVAARWPSSGVMVAVGYDEVTAARAVSPGPRAGRGSRSKGWAGQWIIRVGPAVR